MSAPNRDSFTYTLGFAAAVCLVCAVVVSSAAVLLRPKQEQNQLVDRRSKVLEIAGLLDPGEDLSAAAVIERFEKHIVPRVVDLREGRYNDTIDAKTYDQRRALKDPELSYAAPPNPARVRRLPKHALVYLVMTGDQVDALILPVEGYGLWSTLYGYLALEADGQTVAGITFYEHGETPGLGGEIDNPRWQERWRGRRAFDDAGDVKLQVIKGRAGSPAEDPYRVDGLSGATITARGVSEMLQFWLGKQAFGPFFDTYRAQQGERSAL